MHGSEWRRAGVERRACPEDFCRGPGERQAVVMVIVKRGHTKEVLKRFIEGRANDSTVCGWGGDRKGSIIWFLKLTIWWWNGIDGDGDTVHWDRVWLSELLFKGWLVLLMCIDVKAGRVVVYWWTVMLKMDWMAQSTLMKQRSAARRRIELIFQR